MMNILFYFLLGLLQDGKRLIPLLLQSGGGGSCHFLAVCAQSLRRSLRRDPY